MRTMRSKLLSFAVGVLATPILAHALAPPTAPPSGFCSNASPASSAALAAVNAVLAFFGYPPIGC